MTELHVGIPVYDEWPWLCHTLEALAAQRYRSFSVWLCVNQPRDLAPAAPAAESNRRVLAWLARERAQFPFPVHVIDATGDAAPEPKVAGVGWARRVLFDAVCEAVGPDFVGVSLDADTHCPPDYLAAVAEVFAADPEVGGLTAPYRHPVPDDPRVARALLRYELWMRYYQLNLWRIGSPFAFSALGSNLAFRGAAYRRAGGFPLRQAGEDFYLLQQLCKTTQVAVWCAAEVAPAARLSGRVPFGTGTVLGAPDLALQRTRFPFYDPGDFDRIGETYALWPELFAAEPALPIDAFLSRRLKGRAPFARMRKNFAGDATRFIRACYERLDGLRLLQCLRFYRTQVLETGGCPPVDETALAILARRLAMPVVPAFNFETCPLADLVQQRDLWADWEHAHRRRAGRIGLDTVVAALGR